MRLLKQLQVAQQQHQKSPPLLLILLNREQETSSTTTSSAEVTSGATENTVNKKHKQILCLCLMFNMLIAGGDGMKYFILQQLSYGYSL